MDLFNEFFGIIREFQKHNIAYAVVGGIAMALHDEPRFTRDIDVLVSAEQVGRVRELLEGIGYVEASAPWTFAGVPLTLHRFIKTQAEDSLTVDILFGTEPRIRGILERTTEQPWADGVARVAGKEDIIWMKRQRGSDQDHVDIRKLQDDAD